MIELTSIIVVEDESIVRMDIIEMLKEAQYEVVAEAGNGEKALELVDKFRPDLVIMDIKMPIMNGLEATRIIREEGASLPIIMQTAYAFSSDRENAMQAGASEVLVKPITVSALRGCLSSYFPEIKW